MKRYELRKEETKQRLDALEKRRDDFYSQMGQMENEIEDMWTKATEMQEKLVNFKKKGDVLDSYMEFLENQLVIEALEAQSYSIENFDLAEKDRLMVVLRRGEDILFDWYVQKKKEGYEFNQIEPLHKILKEDYEDYYNQRIEDEDT
ncbi:hypothetical protein KV134_00830 [Tetragenococcus halophilus]|uniref:Uncharacterized protein n=1 Tax=Tetragenococcus halophilus (strain DSM 20338 / JCM 20259 / NCIMB 9735 / NBRC 12172) TaxID=945021 RepID=A0AAN1VQ24_TETHN|nr:hypothetical protein [Tetragenococcus halophilus]MCO7025809.1 hypothetical protein [Tetragenococcus halophilus]NRR75807.1 hypothetical protein [Tetragenococcus halophilus]NWN99977.1 hypothetical protein [Tetragenococcus halophilus]QXN87080.1 hypothetical protein KV134_00830 [Tetragenococcus halophilus]RQD30728.1 hypothetical protein C7K42_07075 [Tetragenococcus halophilus subsp. halophilus DSM 20339]